MGIWKVLNVVDQYSIMKLERRVVSSHFVWMIANYCRSHWPRFMMTDCWNTVYQQDDEDMLVHEEIAEYAGLPPFRKMIPACFIHQHILDPSLCLLFDINRNRCKRGYMRVIRYQHPCGVYKQICTDGAYTKGVRASYAAVARDVSGWCDGYRLGLTSDLTPCNVVHELIGAKHGLILGEVLDYEYLELVLDCRTAVLLIENLFKDVGGCSTLMELKKADASTEEFTNPDGRKSIPDIANAIEGEDSNQDSQDWNVVEGRGSKRWAATVLKATRDAANQRAAELAQLERIETARNNVLKDIEQLIRRNWIKGGEIKIKIKCVPREGNFMADNLSHIVSEFT